MDLDKIAFECVKQLSGCSHFYDSTINDCIMAVSHHNFDINLLPEDFAKVKDMIKNAFNSLR